MDAFKSHVQNFNPRDRIQLEIDLRSHTYAPGDTVKGTLNVMVRKIVAVTAIRIHLIGKEKCDVGGSRSAIDREFVHLERLVTVFGFSKGSKRRTGAELAEGTYAYPFALTIPLEAPPSYAMQLPRKSSFFSRMTYKLTAVAVMPYNVDRTVQRELTVLSVIPKSQYQASADKITTLPKTELELIKSTSCCASKKREYLEVTASLHPYYLLVPTEETIVRDECTIGLSGIQTDAAVAAHQTGSPASPWQAQGFTDGTANPVTTVARPVSSSTEPYAFDSVRKGNAGAAAAPTPAPRPSAPEPSYTHFDSAHKGTQPCNGDSDAVAPVMDDAPPPYGNIRQDNTLPPHQMSSGAVSVPPTQRNLHMNYTSALSEAERIAARELSVKVNLFNATNGNITFFRITLVQHRSVSSGGVTEESHQVVCTHDVIPSPPLRAGERRTFDEQLVFTGPMRTHENKDKKTVTLPVPSMCTNMMRSGDTELTVSFPKMKNLVGLARVTNVCAFASDVSETARFPDVPARYSQPFLFPEVAESAV